VSVQADGATLPSKPGGSRALLDLTLDTGGVLARGEHLFRASATGRRLRPE
jgi:hypothetical protein